MRRLSLLVLSWALPAALWAAQWRAPEARLPVQLSLPLEGPAAALSAAPALPSAAALPALPALPASYQHAPEHVDNPPAPAAAAAAPAAPAMPAPVAQALKAGDAHQERVLREGADRAAADRAFFDGQRAGAPPLDISAPERRSSRVPKARAAKRPAKIDYDAFGRLIALTPRLSESPFRDTEAKRRILLASGYTHLIGPGGTRVPLSIADEARVGRAFQNTLKTYRRRKT